MAKTSVIERNSKRIRLYEKYEAKRNELKKIASNRAGDPGEIFEASQALASLPRNSAKNRQRNRCKLTGRGRGFYGKFQLSRIALRELANSGELPGVKKASW